MTIGDETRIALTKYIIDTKVLTDGGHLVLTCDGMPVAISVAHAIHALSLLKRGDFLDMDMTSIKESDL